jgi:hypothetical protein
VSPINWKAAARYYRGSAELSEWALEQAVADHEATRQKLREAQAGLRKVTEKRAKWKRRAHAYRNRWKALRQCPHCAARERLSCWGCGRKVTS